MGIHPRRSAAGSQARGGLVMAGFWEAWCNLVGPAAANKITRGVLLYRFCARTIHRGTEERLSLIDNNGDIVHAIENIDETTCQSL